MHNKPIVCLFLLAALVLPFASAFASTNLFSESAPHVPVPGGTSEYQTALVWQYGGTLNAVEVVGDIAYASIGQRFVVLDLSAPGGATMIGQSEPLSVPLEALAVQGSYAYGVYSIKNRSGWLVVIDIQDPTQPRQVAIVETMGSARDVIVDGSYAYVADSQEGIALVDISDPAKAVYVQNVAGGLNAVHGLEKSGDYLFVAADSDGLVVLDVLDPLNPVETYQFTDPVYGSDVSSLFLSGSRLLVNDSLGLHIFDLNDLSHPTHRSTLHSVDEHMTFDQSVALGNYLYAFDMYFGASSAIGGDVGLRIFDISNPENPASLASLSEFIGQPYCGQIKLAGSQLFIPACDRGLEIYDLSSPLAPTRAIHHPVDGSATQVLREGTYAYAGSHGFGPSRLTVFDLSDIGHPQKLGSAEVDGQLQIMVGGRAYLYHAYYDETYTPLYEMNIYDAQDPGQIEQVDQLVLGGELRDLAVYEGFAYALIDDSLKIYNVADPSHPVEAGFLLNVYGDELAVATGTSDPSQIYAYVLYAYGTMGLKVLDVTDAAAPVEVGNEATFIDFDQDIVVHGNYAYAISSDSIGKFDISDPTDPVQTPDSAGVAGYCNWESVSVSQNYAHVATGCDGFYVFDLETLGKRAYQKIPTTVLAVAVFDDYTLLASQESGLYLVWVGPQSSAEITAIAGGTLISLFDRTEIVFPAGGLEQDRELLHLPRYLPDTPQPALPHKLLGPVFELDYVHVFGQPPIQVLQPFTISVPYNDYAGMGFDEHTLALYRLENGQWVPVASSTLDLENGVVTAESSQLGTYAVIGELNLPEIHYLPMIVK